MKVQRFIKAPKKGDIIKVFDARDGFSYFGIAEKIEIKTHKSKMLKSTSEIGKVRKEISAMLSNIYKEARKRGETREKFLRSKKGISMKEKLDKLREQRNNIYELERRDIKRELVVVKKTDETYPINEVDFFLPETKVILHTTNQQNKRKSFKKKI